MRSVAFGMLMLAAGVPAGAADDLAQRFGARERSDVRLSPDGKLLSFLRPAQGAATAVFVASIDGSAAPHVVLVTTGNQDAVSSCNWIAPTRLVCRLSLAKHDARDFINANSMVAIDTVAGTVKPLIQGQVSTYGGSLIDLTGGTGEGSVLLTRVYGTTASTGTMFGGASGGMGVESVDTTTLKHQPVEPAQGGAAGFISDGRGAVRIMGKTGYTEAGRLKSDVRWYYRTPGDRTWRDLSTVTTLPSGQTAGFDPDYIDPQLNAAYGFDDDGHGRSAVYRVALDGSGKKEMVLDRPDVDVDGLLTVGRQRRVVGASFATERREAVFFDPKLKAIAASLAKALPAGDQIDFVDASADESKLVLFVGSDVDPGRFYLFDVPGRKLTEILPARPELAGLPLAHVQAITFKAADGTPIPAYLTLPPGGAAKGLPAIVMPHGGPAARDEWGFDWLSQYFAAKGYAVLQPNYRGSTGYGSQWFQKNGFQSWRVAIGDVNDAGRYLLSSGIAAPGKLAIVGWSYGGYAALQSAVLDPDLFKAIVAVAPVTDLPTLRDERKDYDDYNIVAAQIGRGPQLTEGSPAQNAGRIKAPVLLFQGDFDQNVGIGESRLMAARLKAAGKQVDSVEFKGLDHQLDDPAARATLLERSDQFLRKAMGL